jgi:DNA-binding IclR family transcriptional regulator
VEELLPGYWVLAAGIGGQDDCPAAAISITLPLDEFTPEKETSIAALLKEAARKSSLQLGHSGITRAIASRA